MADITVEVIKDLGTYEADRSKVEFKVIRYNGKGSPKLDLFAFWRRDTSEDWSRGKRPALDADLIQFMQENDILEKAAEAILQFESRQ